MREHGLRRGLLLAAFGPGDHVQPVLQASPGRQDVQRFPAQALGDQSVRDIDGAALRGVDSGGVTQGGGFLRVPGREGEPGRPGPVGQPPPRLDLPVAAVAVDPGDLEDVPVGQPLAPGGDQLVVEPGLDPVADLGQVAVAEPDPLRSGPAPGRLPGPGHVLGGLPVQLGDLGLRLGDHHRVQARPHGGGPVQHHVPPGLVLTPGVHATPCLVVRDHGDVTVPEPERGVFLPLLGEPVHFVDFQGAEPVSQQREHAARVDRAQLELIADRHDPRPGLVGGGLQFEQVGGVDLPGLVQEDHVTRADLDRVDGGPAGGLAQEPGQVVAERGRPGVVHLLGRDPGGILRHGDRVHQAAGQLRPCLGERPGQPGLAGARRRTDQRHGLIRGEQCLQRRGLVRTQLPRRHGGLGPLRMHQPGPGLAGLAEDVLLGVEVADGGVLLLARRPVDRLAIRGAHAEIVDVQAARRRVEQHDVDVVDLAGQRVGGHLLQQRH